MKKLLFTTLFAALALVAFPQSSPDSVVIGTPEYDAMKAAGTLPATIIPAPVQSTVMNTSTYPVAGSGSRSGSCDCYVDPDSSYTSAIGPNDDGSTALLPIPFNFCFYGQQITAVYVNNNGNISFGAPFGTFSSNSFPDPTFDMVAPFWGDIDTRLVNGVPNGEVLYKITPTAMYVNWVDCGYYALHDDKKVTFQLIITDGNDPAVPGGGNIAFCYKNMDWTTGDASQGVNGFGGVPSTVGVNRGNGVDYLQMGRFDQAGTAYDGSYGNNDGVDWLDFQTFYFNVCNASNLPPIANGVAPCDTFRICSLGDTLLLNSVFLAPEIGQNTALTINGNGMSGFSTFGMQNGNTAMGGAMVIGDNLNIGYNTVTFSATDNGNPNQTTTVDVVVWVDTTGTSNFNVDIMGPDYICPGGSATLDAGGPYDTYYWSDFTNQQTTAVSDSGLYSVTVSLNGCYKSDQHYLNIAPSGNPVILGDSCAAIGGSSTLVLQDSVLYTSINWSSGGQFATEVVNGAGTYTVNLVDTFGCSGSTNFVVSGAPTVMPDTLICDAFVVGLDATSLGGGLWTIDQNPTGLPVSIADSAADNTSFTVDTTGGAFGYGVYSFIYSNASCSTVDTVFINLVEPAWPFALGDTCIQPGASGILFIPDSTAFSNILWGTGDTTFSIVSNGPGNYQFTAIDTVGCTNTNSFTVYDLPTIGPDYFDCNSFVINLDATSAAGGTWVNTSNPTGLPINIDDPTVNNTTATVDTTGGADGYGTYTFVFTDAVCNVSQTINVNLLEPQWPFAIGDTCLNSGDPGALNIVNPDGFASILWGSGDTTFTVATNGPGVYTFTAIDTAGCENTNSFTVYTPPTIGPDAFECDDYYGDLTATSSGGGYWWVGNGPGNITFDDINQNNTGATADAYGVYTINYTDFTCQMTETLQVTFSTAPSGWLPILEACLGDEVTFDAGNTGIGATYDWSTGETTQTIATTLGGEYTVTVSNSCGTVDLVGQYNQDLCAILPPNVFSPNGDGLNQAFVIAGLEEHPNTYVAIYNRWGKMVYETDNYLNDWDGENYNDGVYYYVIKTQRGEEMTGTVQIIRGN